MSVDMSFISGNLSGFLVGAETLVRMNERQNNCMKPVNNWITIGSSNSKLSKNGCTAVLVIYVLGTVNFVTSRISFTL